MAIAVEIVTPEKVVGHADVDGVVVPAADGELGILPHHAPLLAQLQPGQVKFRSGDATDLFAVSGGFIEVKADRVTIFAETAEMAQDIDTERAKQAAERAKSILKSSRTEEDLAQAEAALQRALARLRAVEGLRRTGRHPRRPS